MKQSIQTFILEQTNAKIDATLNSIDSLNIAINFHEERLANLLEERNQLQAVIDMAIADYTAVLSTEAD